MTADSDPAYDGRTGLAGGVAFGRALRELACVKGRDEAAVAAAAGLELAQFSAICAGTSRVSVAILARLAAALELRAIEFLQATALLSLTVYAAGLDPLYFLPEGQIRKDARIYMREINPRHPVPERDMLVRNPLLAALRTDSVLDAAGRLELELTYLLRAAVQQTGGYL